MPAPCVLSVGHANPLSGEPEELCLAKLGVWVTIERDGQYVDPQTELPQVGSVISELSLGADPVDFSLVFESIFQNAKLLEGEGLYAAIFPRDALRVFPIEKREAFYSLRPLSTKRFGQAGVEVESLDGEPARVDYFDIDLEQWASEFFAFYERILGQECLDRLLCGEGREENAAALDALLKLKRAFAGRITGRAQGVLSGLPAPESAVSCIREALLKDLSDGYAASGAVVYAAPGKLGGAWPGR